MPVLADYRSDVYNNLAGASDASKWTPTMIDTALRQALGELNSLLVYEGDFTVTVAGYQQDLSGITAINQVLGVAYPWVEGSEFGRCVVGWRFVGQNLIYLAHAQPAVGEKLRVRYTKVHTIQNLDGAGATSVPDQYRVLVGLWGAAYACEMRFRQVGERHLAEAAQRLRERAEREMSQRPPLGPVRWGNIGL